MSKNLRLTRGQFDALSDDEKYQAFLSVIEVLDMLAKSTIDGTERLKKQVEALIQSRSLDT